MNFMAILRKVVKGAASGGTALALVAFLPVSTELKTAIGVVASAAIHGISEIINQHN